MKTIFLIIFASVFSISAMADEPVCHVKEKGPDAFGPSGVSEELIDQARLEIFDALQSQGWAMRPEDKIDTSQGLYSASFCDIRVFRGINVNVPSLNYQSSEVYKLRLDTLGTVYVIWTLPSAADVAQGLYVSFADVFTPDGEDLLSGVVQRYQDGAEYIEWSDNQTSF